LPQKERKSLPEVVAFLRAVADSLERQGILTLGQDNSQVEVCPAGEIILEVEYEVKGDSHELELELAWETEPAPPAVD
jgi:amphi-Trp domain-containing protein